jgi:hypothetical protein
MSISASFHRRAGGFSSFAMAPRLMPGHPNGAMQLARTTLESGWLEFPQSIE